MTEELNIVFIASEYATNIQPWVVCVHKFGVKESKTFNTLHIITVKMLNVGVNAVKKRADKMLQQE